RVMGGKRQERIFRVRTAADGVSIPAIFRRQYLLLLNSVVVAVRPPVVPAFVEVEELLGRQHGVILGCEEVREEETQVASSMLYSVQFAVFRVQGDRDQVPELRRETARRGVDLANEIRVIPPDPRPDRHVGARIE